jgi:hypothetical protein
MIAQRPRPLFELPRPEQRVTVDLYVEVRAWLLENDPDAEPLWTWSMLEVGLPETPEKLAQEVTWIILCAGRSAQSARTIEKRVYAAMAAGRPVVEAFGYRAKAEAIERAWREREADFNVLSAIGNADVDKLVAWCGSISYVGSVTRYQLAKNVGADLVKPDIWLSRLAGFPDRPCRAAEIRFASCMDLCRPLAAATGDRIAAVDSLLWLACNKGVLEVGAQAGPVAFNRRPITARSMLVAAD